MVLGLEDDQGCHDHMNLFMWENQSSWGLSTSENSDYETNKNKLLGISEKNSPAPQNKEIIIIGESNDEETQVKNRGIRNSNGKRVMDHGGSDGRSREADHELHIWTERERRKKMRNMFSNLHALLPQLPSKADKSMIVDEAVRQIKCLEKTVEKLEKMKRDKDQAGVSPIGCESSSVINYMHDYYSSSSNNSSPSSSSSSFIPPPSSSSLSVGFKTTFVSPNLVLTMFGNNEAQFSICAAKKQGLSSTIAFVLEKYKLDVLYATIVCNSDANRYIILVQANRALGQFQDAGSVEQTFRRAAGEIMMWLS